MENINWFVTIIIGALISIPFAVFANLLTPKIGNWFSKYSLVVRQNNVAKLRKELATLENYSTNKEAMYLDLVDKGIVLFLLFLAGVIFSSLGGLSVMLYLSGNSVAVVNRLGRIAIPSDVVMLSVVFFLPAITFWIITLIYSAHISSQIEQYKSIAFYTNAIKQKIATLEKQ